MRHLVAFSYIPRADLALQAAWSIAFSQEQLVLAAILLVAIAVALGLAVVGLAPYKMNLLASVQSVEFWVVHFPIGLHAGWTCAGESCPLDSGIFVRKNFATELPS